MYKIPFQETFTVLLLNLCHCVSPTHHSPNNSLGAQMTIFICKLFLLSMKHSLLHLQQRLHAAPPLRLSEQSIQQMHPQPDNAPSYYQVECSKLDSIVE